MSPAKKIAVVDIGTNSVRLVVALANGRRIESVLFQDGRITRLGEGLAEHGQISRGAVDRTVSVLSVYAGHIRSYAPDCALYVGTSALRQAENREEVLARFEREAGIPVRIISGEEEAALTYRGALLDLDEAQGPFLVIDIGGGSSELIVGETVRKFWKAFSVEVGVVTLTEGEKKWQRAVSYVERRRWSGTRSATLTASQKDFSNPISRPSGPLSKGSPGASASAPAASEAARFRRPSSHDTSPFGPENQGRKGFFLTHSPDSPSPSMQ